MKYGSLYVKILPFSLLEEGSDDVTTKNASLWHVMPLQSGNRYLWYTRTCRVGSLGWRWRQNASPQRWYLYTKQYDVKPQGTVTFFPWSFPTKLRHCFVRDIANYKSNGEWRWSCCMTPTLYFPQFSAPCSVVGPSVRVGMLGAASCGLLVVAQLFLLLLTVTAELVPSLPVTPVASSSVSSLRPATALTL